MNKSTKNDKIYKKSMTNSWKIEQKLTQTCLKKAFSDQKFEEISQKSQASGPNFGPLLKNFQNLNEKFEECMASDSKIVDFNTHEEEH